MKQWLLYFFAVVAITALVPVAANRACAPDSQPKLTLLSGSEVTEITAEEFALGLLLSEGEALASQEAKQAFAAVARSIACNIAYRGYRHADFCLCSDPACCPALADPESVSAEYLKECTLAVEATRGQALRFEGLPAATPFTYCAGSGTLAHSELAYLVSVAEPSPCTDHGTQLKISYARLKEAFPRLAELGNGQISENSVAVYDSMGKCSFCLLGGEYIGAADLKAALSLPSSQFSLAFGDGEISFECFGQGDCLGLSLCGAEKMAQDGKTAEEILAFYFPKLELSKIY